MFDEHVLDLGGSDVLAAADDRVVGPAADEQVAALVKHRNVFGGEPAVGVEHRTDVGIAARHLLAADVQLPGLPGSEDCPGLAADLYLDARHRLTDRPEPPGYRIVGSGQGFPVVV